MATYIAKCFFTDHKNRRFSNGDHFEERHVFGSDGKQKIRVKKYAPIEGTHSFREEEIKRSKSDAVKYGDVISLRKVPKAKKAPFFALPKSEPRGPHEIIVVSHTDLSRMSSKEREAVGLGGRVLNTMDSMAAKAEPNIKET